MSREEFIKILSDSENYDVDFGLFPKALYR